MKKIVCVIGTRPEAIKMAPVILALKKETWVKPVLIATAQHRQMLDQVLKLFNIVPDYDLNAMTPNQTLPTLTAKLLVQLDEIFSSISPDAVLAQGDTTTVMATALASFYRKLPFGHIEAGLRTGDLMNPFPEEANRVITGHLARWHFAPTMSSLNNLLREGISRDNVYVTGNTVIDSLLDVAKREIESSIDVPIGKRLILLTSHRRENFGGPFQEICKAIRFIADSYSDVHILYPVHPNPNIKEIAYRELSDHERISLCEPLEYGPFISIMKRAYIILSDSGGVQEEAPALGKPVLVLRSETERPEAVEEGVVRLVGPIRDNIIKEVSTLLEDKGAYGAMARGVSPYGDGKASSRIVDILKYSLI